MPEEPQSTYNGPVAAGDGDAVDARNSQGAVIKPRGPVASGENATAIDLRGSLFVQTVKKRPFVIVGALVVLGIFVSVLIRYPPAFITRLIPMQGMFNVAVAEFVEMEPDGHTFRSSEARQLSEWVFEAIQQRIGREEIPFVFELRPPDQVGPVQGRTSRERTMSAARVADSIDADIVIYGVLVGDDLHPAFYVYHRGFYNVEEVVGQHAMGTPISIRRPVQGLNSAVSVEVVRNRSRILSLIAVGLAYYSESYFDIAFEYFEQACQLSGWNDQEGKEVVYQMLGNAVGRQGAYPEAAEYFEKAIDLNPDYTRGYLGLGAAVFHQALQKDEGFSEEQVLDALGEASELLERAIAAEDRSEHADVESKYHFLMGEIQLVKTQLGHPHLLSEAKNHFEHVIGDYQSGNSRIWVKAAQSYAHLGLVAQAERQPLDQVITFYRQAAEIVNDQDNELAAKYWGKIGEIYFDHELYRESANAYRKASELTTDSQRKTNYQKLQKHSEELVDESQL